MNVLEYMLPGSSEAQQRLTTEMRSKEDLVLHNVLTQYLGRAPDFEKDKGCLGVVNYPDTIDRYGIVTPEGVHLGDVHRRFVQDADGSRFIIEFVPRP